MLLWVGVVCELVVLGRNDDHDIGESGTEGSPLKHIVASKLASKPGPHQG
jgi:hypothetical protein